MARLGILDCSQYACRELTALAAAAKEAKGVFKELGPVDLVGCVACQRHPEKRIFDGAKLLAKWGADIIALSFGDSDGPHSDRILNELSRRVSPTIILDCRNGLGV